MLVQEFYTEMKAYIRKLALYPEVRKKHTYVTIVYESIEPLTYQLMLWSLERFLPKIWRSKLIKHDVSHILSNKEEFISFWEQIETQEVINRPHKSSKINTGDSGKKLGADTSHLPSTPRSEGYRKKGKNQNSGKRGNCLLHRGRSRFG